MTQAATKAGAHAHMPSSSQEWKMYPAISFSVGPLRSTAPVNLAPLRACTVFAIGRSTSITSPAPSADAIAVAAKAVM